MIPSQFNSLVVSRNFLAFSKMGEPICWVFGGLLFLCHVVFELLEFVFEFVYGVLCGVYEGAGPDDF